MLGKSKTTQISVYCFPSYILHPIFLLCETKSTRYIFCIEPSLVG